jgi:bacillithiol biosynthesis cysteine-adding enzyme BshC
MLLHLGMDVNCIDYSETGSFSTAVIDYLEDKSALKPFYNFRPDLDGFSQLIRKRKQPANRQVLVNALKAQYASIETSRLTRENIELLSENNTYTITTGHQLNIFTGPLYFIYKIATAIKLATELKEKFPDHNFVPVYWMASEDHDFAEINHTHIAQKRISWEQSVNGATGKLSTESIHDALNSYVEILGISENSRNLGAIVKKAYTDFKTLADATRYLVDALFNSYGLLVIDADDTSLKKLFAPYIERDIIEQNSFHHIKQSSEALQQIGYHTQVNSREINFFYLRDTFRERIVADNGVYQVLNSDYSFSEPALKTEIEQHPEHFSPNVVMRPLYQEIILPNLAYIGGGAEVVYWMQLKANFEYYKVDFPILILRNSALLITKSQAHKLNKTGIDLSMLFQPIDRIKTYWVETHSSNILNLKDELVDLQAVFSQIKVKAQKVDTTLGPSTESIQVRLERAITNLEKKMIKAEKYHYQNSLSQIDKIKEQLFPNGGLQERYENFGLYYAAWGPALIDSLIKNFKPLDFKFTILTEE